MDKFIFLILDDYSNNKNFIETEMQYLRKYYKVIIISYDKVNDEEKEKYADVDFWQGPSTGISLLDVLVILPHFASFEGNGSEVGSIVKERIFIVKRMISSFSFYIRSYKFSKWFSEKIKGLKDKQILVYSYWYNEKVLGSILTKSKLKRNFKIITRAHGYDLYKYRKPYLWQPFKTYMNKNIDGTFFISQQGYQYFFNEFVDKEKKQKYQVFPIGAPQYGEPNFKDGRKNKFLLVSCSRVVKLKRLDLLVDALASIQESVTWVHFGDGPEFNTLKEKCKTNFENTHISYQLMGNLPKCDILKYYSTYEVACFINISETEGSPVSIQEALSAAIPIIATDVGGNSETVVNNGILLKANPSVKEIADAILQIYNLDEKTYNLYKKNSYNLWKRTFDADLNAKKFVDYLVKNY